MVLRVLYKFRSEKMIIIRYLIALGLSFLALCIQHPIHEFSHVIATQLCGEKVTRIQWLSYHGGTRVFYENEPDFMSENINRKWVFIAGAAL
jgi:hypothetical protein